MRPCSLPRPEDPLRRTYRAVAVMLTWDPLSARILCRKPVLLIPLTDLRSTDMATQSNRLVAANTERSFRACPAQDMRHAALGLNSRRMPAGAASALDAAELRRALESQELTLHYQPKLTVGGSTMVVGVEALVRWNHPQLGLLLPGQFLPLAETAGLLTEITDFTITEAIQQHALWRDNGIDLSVAVNLAPALIKDEGFPDRLISSLRQFGVPPTRLTLDVKEMDGLSDRALCLEAFTRLRAA